MKGKKYIAFHMNGRDTNLLIKEQKLSSGISSWDSAIAGVKLNKYDAEWIIATLSRRFLHKFRSR